MTTSTSTTPVINLADAIKFPKYNIAEYPDRDGVRFAVSLRKELEAGGVQGVRSQFIATFVRLGKTPAHASNYWDKTNKQRLGIDVHKTNKTWQAKQPKKSTAKQVVETVDLPPETVVEPIVTVDTTPVEHHRWLIVNSDTNEIITSFTSRDLAQKDNKIRRENGEKVTWKDKTKM